MSMWLVDTSVWIDHLRSGDAVLVKALQDGRVLGHPWVLGEIALGSLKNRGLVLSALRGLPQASVAHTEEVLALLDSQKLHGKGLGFVDVALLAATRLTPHAQLWTRDKRLQAVARSLGVAAQVGH
jgi:predicted nucleic acid-binding protein